MVWAIPVGFHDGVPITLPRIANATAALVCAREDALQVVIPRDGKIFFGSRQIGPEELPSRLQRPRKSIILRVVPGLQPAATSASIRAHPHDPQYGFS
jgi:biopolymer transport protein ExbD